MIPRHPAAVVIEAMNLGLSVQLGNEVYSLEPDTGEHLRMQATLQSPGKPDEKFWSTTLGTSQMSLNRFLALCQGLSLEDLAGIAMDLTVMSVRRKRLRTGDSPERV